MRFRNVSVDAGVNALSRNVGRCRARPATGFSLDIRALVSLGERPFRKAGAIWAPADNDAALEGVISGLRMTETVIRALPDDRETDPSERGCDRQLVNRDGQWVVETIA